MNVGRFVSLHVHVTEYGCECVCPWVNVCVCLWVDVSVCMCVSQQELYKPGQHLKRCIKC